MNLVREMTEGELTPYHNIRVEAFRDILRTWSRSLTDSSTTYYQEKTDGMSRIITCVLYGKVTGWCKKRGWVGNKSINAIYNSGLKKNATFPSQELLGVT